MWQPRWHLLPKGSGPPRLFRVKGLRVEGLGFRVAVIWNPHLQGLGFEVKGLGSRGSRDWRGSLRAEGLSHG